MRTCSLCGIPDHPVILDDRCNCAGGDDLAGHATGCKGIQHFVAQDIKWHCDKAGQPLPIPLAMQRKGWRDRGIFQGKPAIERVICRECLRKQDEVIEIEAFRKKRGEEAEGGAEMNMYQILCS